MYSEDYYGDLDLVSLRQSQLLLGTFGTGAAGGGNVPRPRARPSAAAAAAQPAADAQA